MQKVISWSDLKTRKDRVPSKVGILTGISMAINIAIGLYFVAVFVAYVANVLWMK